MALLWATGCADPCLDDGLSQDPGDGSNCPVLTGSGSATDGTPDPTTSSGVVDASGGSSCNNGIQDGDETDVDCGGSCDDKCGGGQGCGSNDDCDSQNCENDGTCSDPPGGDCMDGMLNGDETDVDCGGGTCPQCDNGEMCIEPSDCISGLCEGDICVPDGGATCDDGEQNGDETDIDCGGGTCPPCPTGDDCIEGSDCESGVCDGDTCVDPPPECRDGTQNGDETDLDCGGPDCPACDDGDDCLENGDCVSDYCNPMMICATPACDDGIQNQDETDLDCGGTCGSTCEIDEDCLISADCISQWCEPMASTCATPACDDGIQNGDETDLDCGGACGATCEPGEGCLVGMDCLSMGCDAGSNTCNDYLSVDASPACSEYMGMPVPLSANASGGSGMYTYAWTPDDGTLSDPMMAMTDASPSGFQNYTVTVDDGFTMAQDNLLVVDSSPFDLQNNCTLYAGDFSMSSGAPSISYDMMGARACETANNDFGLHLCEGVDFQSVQLQGTVEVLTGAGDDDIVGLVWGAQDNTQFYSLTWKGGTQAFFGCTIPAGIVVKRIDTPAFGDLVGSDMFCPNDTARSTLLLDETGTTNQGWDHGESYTISIDFTDLGSNVSVVRDSDMVELANFSIGDNTYTNGFFGSITFSQSDACVGPLLAQCL